MIVVIRRTVVADVAVGIVVTIRIAVIDPYVFRPGTIRRVVRVACGSRVGRLVDSLAPRIATGCTVACRTARSFCTTATHGMPITTGTVMSGVIAGVCRA